MKKKPVKVSEETVKRCSELIHKLSTLSLEYCDSNTGDILFTTCLIDIALEVLAATAGWDESLTLERLSMTVNKVMSVKRVDFKEMREKHEC